MNAPTSVNSHLTNGRAPRRAREDPQPTESPGRPSPYERTFWFPLAGLSSALLCTVVLQPTGLLTRTPGIGELLGEPGAVGVVSFLILVFALWVLLYAMFRVLVLRAEFQEAARVLEQFKKRRTADRQSGRSNAVVWARIPQSGVHAGPPSADDGVLMTTRAEIDHARSEVSYLPARALVWALPALGFIGTAKTMSAALQPLNGGNTGLDLTSVVGPLGSAFDITVFALGAAVLCHVLLTWTTAREQRLLVTVEEAALEAYRVSAAAAAGDPAGRLNESIGRLSDQVDSIQETLESTAVTLSALDLDGLAGLDAFTGVRPLLQSIDERLRRIGDEVGQDLVITRSGLH